MNNSKSPWSAYGRLPLETPKPAAAPAEDPTLGAIDNLQRGREQVQKYLAGLVREYNESRSGRTGYRAIVDDALNPSNAPETIEERLTRLAREAVARRSRRSTRPRPG
jgi:hypothetical protein